MKDEGNEIRKILLYQQDETGILPKAFETQEKMSYPWIQVISGVYKEKYVCKLYLNEGYAPGTESVRYLKMCFDTIQKWVKKRGTPVPG